MSNFSESDLIFNAMTPAEQARAWEIFGQLTTGQISQEQASQAQQQNEQRAREQLNQFFGGQPAPSGSGGTTTGGGSSGTEPVKCEPPYVFDEETQSCMLPEQIQAREQERAAEAERQRQRENEKKDGETEAFGTTRNPSAVFQGLAGFLSSIGLGSLFRYEGGRPSGWLWDQIKAGIETRDELLFALEQTPEFRQRFSVIFRMRDANSPYVPTAEQVLEYEQDFFQLMNSAGVPSWFYDSNDDAQRAMETGLAITQVEDRLQRGFQVMQRMPSEVRDVFAEYYGQSAEGAMLAAILDPQKTLNEIDRSVRVGQIGGFGRRANFEITRAQAEQFGQVPMSEAEIRQGVQTAAEFRPLTVETFGERQDLTDTTALEAGLGGSAVDRALLENRLRTRQAQQAGVGGGATISGTGVTGAGVV